MCVNYKFCHLFSAWRWCWWFSSCIYFREFITLSLWTSTWNGFQYTSEIKWILTATRLFLTIILLTWQWYTVIWWTILSLHINNIRGGVRQEDPRPYMNTYVCDSALAAICSSRNNWFWEYNQWFLFVTSLYGWSHWSEVRYNVIHLYLYTSLRLMLMTH